MIAILALGGAALAVLVIVGRWPALLKSPRRLAQALFAALAAAGAVVAGLRGGWIASLALIALAAWLGSGLRPGPSSSLASPAMSRAEARAILGVGEGASAADIEAAWRRLMVRAHPDQGGSTGLAAQLNAARDRLRN